MSGPLHNIRSQKESFFLKCHPQTGEHFSPTETRLHLLFLSAIEVEHADDTKRVL